MVKAWIWFLVITFIGGMLSNAIGFEIPEMNFRSGEFWGFWTWMLCWAIASEVYDFILNKEKK